METRDDELLAYLLDELAPEERARLEADLAEDAGLAAELEALRASLKDLTPIEPSANALEGFYERRIAPELPKRGGWRAWSIAAGALLALGLGFAAGRLTAPRVAAPATPLEEAYEASQGGESELARGLLALAALERQQ